MAWLETCRIDAKRQVEHLEEKGLSVRQAIKKLSEESGIPQNTINNWIYERTSTKRYDAFYFMLDTIHREWAQEGMITEQKAQEIKKSGEYLVLWGLLWLNLEKEYILNWYREAFTKYGKTTRLTDMLRTGKGWCNCSECKGKSFDHEPPESPRVTKLEGVFTPKGYVNFNAI